MARVRRTVRGPTVRCPEHSPCAGIRNRPTGPRCCAARGCGAHLLLLAVVGAATFFFRDAIFGTPVEIVEATRGDLVQTVVASGRITTPQRVSVGAVITGSITRIPVAEGQFVQRGDVLIVLDDRDLRATEAQAAAAVAQAEARVRQLREVGIACGRAGPGAGAGESRPGASAVRSERRT